MAHSLSLELLGGATLTAAPGVDAGQVGGMSGLAYDGARDLWIAVSDDPRAVRLFEISIELGPRKKDGALALHGARVERAWTIDAEARDAEAVALHPSGELLAIATESPPALLVGSRAGVGAPFSSVAISPEILAAARANRAFESTAFRTPPGAGPLELWIAAESALTIDGADADRARGAPCRMLCFDGAPPFALKRQLIYETDPSPRSLGPAPARVGLVDLEALPDGRLLALERSASIPRGFDATIFIIDPDAPHDVGAPPRIRKSRLAAISEFGILITPNIEGMALGPEIPGAPGIPGTRADRLLLLISDDNFGKGTPAVTTVIALRLSAPRAP